MIPTASKKPVTIYDVAKAAGVSRATAAQVCSGKGRISAPTRASVMEAVRALGYNPNPHAQRLASGRCVNTVAVFSMNLDLGVGTRKLKLIQHCLTEMGFDAPIYTYGSYGGGQHVDAAALIDTACRLQPRALVCLTPGLPQVIERLRSYQEEGGIVVCQTSGKASDGEDDSRFFDCVIHDVEDATYHATRHLLQQGHRSVGLGIHGLQQHKDPREIGFERALKEFGLAPKQDWVFSGYLYEDAGMNYGQQFLALRERPTAFCMLNDVAASAFVNEVMRHGVLVPGDLSVASIDDAPAARACAVPLTTVSQPVQEIASHLLRLLQERLDGTYEGGPRLVMVPGELVERNSVAPPGPVTAQQKVLSQQTPFVSSALLSERG